MTSSLRRWGPPRRFAPSYLAPPPRARFAGDVDERELVRLVAVIRDPEACESVRNFAHAHGLATGLIDPSGTSIALSGTYRDAMGAFRPEGLGIYDDGARNVIARAGYLHVPSVLVPKVVAVMGFDHRKQVRPASSGAAPARTTNGLYRPRDIASYYGMPTWLDGSGQTIAIIAMGGGYDETALESYFQNMGIKRTGALLSVSTDGTANIPAQTGDPSHDDALFEVQMDIKVAASIAPAANVIVYFAAPGGLANLQTALHTAITDKQHKPSVISASWHFPESAASSATLDAFDQILKSAADSNITVCVASGDKGGRESDSVDHPVVSVPACCQYVLGCGGTSLAATGAESAWSTGDNSSGGGYSTRPQPDYQGGIVPDQQHRGVPDVAAFADPGYESGDPDNPNRPFNGTSAATPLWAGLVALINQNRGRPIGFINPTLYQNRNNALNDILSGGNADFQAGPGWDPITGLGSPKGAEILGLF
jgi:kumamolisin